MTLPTMCGANGFAQFYGIVIGVMVAKRLLGVPIDIWPSKNETARLTSGSFGIWRSKEITPPGPYGKSGGEEVKAVSLPGVGCVNLLT